MTRKIEKYPLFYRSVIKGIMTPKKEDSSAGNSKIFSFKNGLQTLPDTIFETYKNENNVNFFLSSEIIKLNFDSNKTSPFSIFFQNKNQKDIKKLEFDHIISTIPAQNLSLLLEPFSTSFSSLQKIPTVSIATINIGYKEDVIPNKFKGFGFLVPPQNKNPVLGVTFDSLIFPEHNNNKLETRLTVMIGGDQSLHENIIDVTNISSHELENISLKFLKKYIFIEQSPTVISTHINKNAIPQYLIGHSNLINNIQKLAQEKFHNKLTIIGNSFFGVSLNDCITASKNSVENLII
jgi:oxygen-dependent protoporphyrinogen oxidase